jgi:cytochrome c553
MDDRKGGGGAQYVAVRSRRVAAVWALSAALVSMLISGLPAARAADGAFGRKIALNGADGVAACVSCHGAKGEGNAPAGFPRLGGLSRLLKFARS